MTKYIVAITLWLCSVSISAQQTFTEKLQQTVETAGRIILYQDKSITDLVNGKKQQQQEAVTSGKRQDDITMPYASSIAEDSLLQGQKVKINGYRIQVYFGDNSRKGKTEARAAGQRFWNLFAELPVYISFVSPHWLCRAGDFRTMEEASDVLRRIREMGVFPEAVIVKSKINVRM